MFRPAPPALAAPLLLLAISCGGESDSKAPLDLVGESREAAEAEKTPAKAKAAKRERPPVVDLIQDHLFRLDRDGWRLTTPGSHISMDRLAAGGVDLVLTAVPPPSGGSAAEDLERGLRKIEELVREAGGRAVLVSGTDEARKVAAGGKVAFGILLEGAGALDGKGPEYLMDLKRRGVMAIGLIGPRGNTFGDPAVAPVAEGGLTEKGAALVSACRDLGILVDLTHASKRTFWDVLVREGSIVAVTHTAARALREHPRNLDDLQILALSRSGGLMGLVLNPDFLAPGEGGADLSTVVAHVEHVREIGAIDALALGTDFGGIRPPSGLPDASALPDLAAALSRAGLDREEVDGVMGNNAMRVLAAVEAKQGAAEAGRAEPLRPLPVDCEAVMGDSTGAALRACDGRLTGSDFTLGAATRQRFRLQDMRFEPVRIEIFGEPGTPWQVEAQNLEGKVLVRRGVALDEKGLGSLPLPSGRNLTRVFVSPTRESNLREAVIWGR